MDEMWHASISPPAIVSDAIEYWFRMKPGGRVVWDIETDGRRAWSRWRSTVMPRD